MIGDNTATVFLQIILHRSCNLGHALTVHVCCCCIILRLKRTFVMWKRRDLNETDLGSPRYQRVSVDLNIKCYHYLQDASYPLFAHKRKKVFFQLDLHTPYCPYSTNIVPKQVCSFLEMFIWTSFTEKILNGCLQLRLHALSQIIKKNLTV